MSGNLKRQDYVAVCSSVVIAALFVGGAIAVMDVLLNWLHPEHAPFDTALRAPVNVLVFGTPFGLYFRARGRERIEAIAIPAFALFLPITFFNIAVSVFLDPTRAPAVINGGAESGPIFSQMVYLQFLRALPAVLLVPVVYWVVLKLIFDRNFPATITEAEVSGDDR